MKRSASDVVTNDGESPKAPKQPRRSTRQAASVPASSPRRSSRRTQAVGAASSTGKPALSDASVVHKITLAKKYDAGSMSVSKWLMSEKLDGMRALWQNGAFYSRQGNKIHAPDYFTKALPRNCALDGELWMGRGQFQTVMSVCRSTKELDGWKDVMYVVFDAPDAAGSIVQRLADAKTAIENASKALDEAGEEYHGYVEILEQNVCKGKKHVEAELQRIEELGGEGVMLRHPKRGFEAGRTADLLKVKSSQDDEALVVGHKKGSGKHSHCLGALICRSRTGIEFKVGSGFSDVQRVNPPSRGTVITFKYFELTESGVPRFPSFDRVRPDVSASVFAK